MPIYRAHKIGPGILFRTRHLSSDTEIEYLIYTLLSTLYQLEGLSTLGAHIAQRIGEVECRRQETEVFIVENKRPKCQK